MKSTIAFLFIAISTSIFLPAQDQKAYDIRLRVNVQGGVNELRFNPSIVTLQNRNEALGPVLMTRELGRTFKGQLAFSLVWKRTKDNSFRETWGISMGYAYNREEYLQYLPQDDFLRYSSTRIYDFLSIPFLISRNFFWGNKTQRLELSAGPEISVFSSSVSGNSSFIPDGYLRSRRRRPEGIKTALSFQALWKGQLKNKQDIGLGFGLDYGLQSVVDQQFQIYAVDTPNIRPAISPDNLLYRVDTQVLPIRYFLILQYDLSLTKRN